MGRESGPAAFDTKNTKDAKDTKRLALKVRLPVRSAPGNR